jgi:hypothetical protein|tara:strand:- start:257 stop:460 length:204 start_codon:yes stop_codon:yes gene_type:complete
MKKVNINPDEFLKDIDSLLDFANMVDGLNTSEDINENDIKKQAEKLGKKITKKYSKYLPKEDLDTKE